ncbi:MAG: LCP family protein, partial [Sciscionella sp.]
PQQGAAPRSADGQPPAASRREPARVQHASRQPSYPATPAAGSAVPKPAAPKPAETRATSSSGGPPDRGAGNRGGSAESGRPGRGDGRLLSGERAALRSAKTMLAVVSLLVFGATAYAWANYGKFFEGFTTANVLDAGAGGEKPADGAEDILLVGMDSRTDAQGRPLPKEMLRFLRAGVSDGELNTDTLILLHIPNDGSRAIAHSIPRDSYVDIPGGYGTHKINSAYQRAKSDALKNLKAKGETDPAKLEVESNQEGAKELVQTVQQLTGVTVDHYASVNLLGFYEITKAIGGVQVCLKNAVDEPLSGADFPAGKQTIEGKQALAFVRQRHGLQRGDLDRIARQQAFLAGIANKVLSAGTLTDTDKLNKLLAAIKRSVVLDQSWDITGFAQQMSGLTGGKIKFKTIPVGTLALSTPEDGDAVEVNPADVSAAVHGTDSAGKKQTPADDKASNAATTVEVRNASAVPDLASHVLSALGEKGFAEGMTGNAAPATDTVVRYPASAQDSAQQVADALTGNPRLEEDPSIPSSNVRVYLGSDYSGVGSHSDSSTATQAEATPAAPTPPPAPITADGTTCVN